MHMTLQMSCPSTPASLAVSEHTLMVGSYYLVRTPSTHSVSHSPHLALAELMMTVTNKSCTHAWHSVVTAEAKLAKQEQSRKPK